MSFNSEFKQPEKLETISKEDFEKLKEQARNIKMYELNQINFPEKARSSLLEPCIAVGIYNPVTRRAYMRHELDMESVDLYETLENIKEKENKDNSDLSQIKVVVTGNSLSAYNTQFRTEKYKRGVLKNRQYTEDNLRGALLKNGYNGEIIFQWLKEDGSGELFVDTEKGNFIVDSWRCKIDEIGRVIKFEEKIEVF